MNNESPCELTVLHYIEAWRYWRIKKVGDSFVLGSLYKTGYLWPKQEKAEVVCDPFWLCGKLKFFTTLPVIFVVLLGQIFLNFSDLLPRTFLWELVRQTGIITLFTLVILALIAWEYFRLRHKNVSECSCSKKSKNSGKSIPSFAGDCGIYGYKSEKLAINADHLSKGIVLGRVALWGNVIEHKFGYRAQYAYPLSVEKGICHQCGNFFPIDINSVLFLHSSYKEFSILCESCYRLFCSRGLLKNFFWRKNIAENYGIPVGSCKPPSGGFPQAKIDRFS